MLSLEKSFGPVDPCWATNTHSKWERFSSKLELNGEKWKKFLQKIYNGAYEAKRPHQQQMKEELSNYIKERSLKDGKHTPIIPRHDRGATLLVNAEDQ